MNVSGININDEHGCRSDVLIVGGGVADIVPADAMGCNESIIHAERKQNFIWPPEPGLHAFQQWTQNLKV